jgi:hypothetical protein
MIIAEAMRTTRATMPHFPKASTLLLFLVPAPAGFILFIFVSPVFPLCAGEPPFAGRRTALIRIAVKAYCKDHVNYIPRFCTVYAWNRKFLRFLIVGERNDVNNEIVWVSVFLTKV